MKRIESAKNQKVKDWKKLHAKKERTKTNTFLIEGEHLVEEALKTPGVVKEIMVADEADFPAMIDESVARYVLSADAFSAIAETETPQAVAAVCRMPESGPFQYEKLLLADAVQDPGNLGTIIRTADAAGIDAVVIGQGTVLRCRALGVCCQLGRCHGALPVIPKGCSMCSSAARRFPSSVE